MSADQDPPASDRTAGLHPAGGGAHDHGRSFGRYQRLERLGSGGMATVYKAHDPSLGRYVALKLLLFEDPQLAQRLLFEAKAQARIQHENVCPIYEAGVEAGRPYIAMHYVEGTTLKGLRDLLSLEQKLKLMKDVAEGVHAAHRAGLVHRDLKPSNVMVERTPEGGWHPYVLDFGLAREADAPGQTQTGAILGTPWYMSPEQARGKGHAVDRRSDVYSLGATLYELLCGKPPFEADSGTAVLFRVIEEDPIPLSVRNPSVPIDVQSIVMKCLEKDPARRYESARALSEDVSRYLDGEPTKARPSGTFQRLARRARKHRAAVTTAGVALVLVVASAGLAFRARSQARAQAQLAAEFAGELQDVEWILRVAQMAPLHDIGREKAQVRQRLAEVRRRMGTLGELAKGPGEYALGRGQLVLGEPRAARGHLETAWKDGYRAPEVAYALGLTLGVLYQRELAIVSSVSAEQRERKTREIQAAYRDPAVAYLRQSTGTAVDAPEYAAGLLAFYEKRNPEALASAERALARVPWLYEARLLQGDVHAGLSRERHETGDAQGSLAALESAEAAYRAASEFARSSPAAYEGLCQVGIQRMEARLYERGDLAPLFEASRAACERVLAADAEQPEAHAKLANIHRFWAEYLIYEGREPFAALDRVAEHAQSAIAMDPANRRAHGNLGIAYRMRAHYEKDHGLPWSESVARALESLGKSVELSGGDAGALNDLGNAYFTRAEAEQESGKDVRPDMRNAVAHYDRALEQVADYGYAHANRGYVLMHLADYEMDHGLDPAASLEAALTSLRRAVELLPKLEGTHTRLAEAHCLRAEYRISRHEDPSDALKQAKSQLREAARINPRPGPEVLGIGRRLTRLEARARR